MGTVIGRSTMDGCRTPVCNECGIFLCFDISEEEYSKNPAFYDAWICEDCNGGVPYNKKFHAATLENEKGIV